MAKTDKRLKGLLESCQLEGPAFIVLNSEIKFAAQKALEARDLLRQAAKCVKGICALTGADVSKVPLIQKINEVLEN